MEAERARFGLTGGCQCGAVRYRLESPPLRANICHCRMCQKAGGSPFMAFTSVRAEDFVVTKGALATFASSDIAKRGFCSACGTPLTYSAAKGADVGVTIASLDDPEAAAPNSQLGVESRLRWLESALAAPSVTTEQWLTRAGIADVGNRQHPDSEI